MELLVSNNDLSEIKIADEIIFVSDGGEKYVVQTNGFQTMNNARSEYKNPILGKENVIKCVKDSGVYIYENAEKIVGTLDRTMDISFTVSLGVNKIPSIEVNKRNRVFVYDD